MDLASEAVAQVNESIPAETEGCFVELYVRHQRSIHAFIVQLVHGHDEAEDLLQKTGLVLWRKFQEFEAGTDFLAWARRIARYEVQAHLRSKRNRKVCFSSETVERLAEEIERQDASPDLRHAALSKCLESLRPSDRDFVRRCYARGASIREVAESLGQSADGAYQKLRRIRLLLLQCIERTISADTQL